MIPWLRQVRVTIGAIDEWRADQLASGPQLPNAIQVYGDGSNDTLRVRFDVHKHLQGTLSPSRVELYNLSVNLRNQIQRQASQQFRNGLTGLNLGLILEAGWQNGQLVQVFSGNVVSCYSHREGPDVITVLQVVSGFKGMLEGPIVGEWSADTPLEEVVLQVVDLMLPKNITVDPSLLNLPNTVMGERGMCTVGTGFEVLNRLGRVYGFTWRIDNGKFIANIDGKDFNGPGILVNSANGLLIEAQPLLNSFFQINAGVSIKTLLHPMIAPGEVVVLESVNNPVLNGSYNIWECHHSGDTHGHQWHTGCMSTVVNSAVQ